MAHFAELDPASIVLRVVVIDNDAIKDDAGIERETLGINLCHQLFGSGSTWKQTSYNANFRKNYAGVGYCYDATRDAFVPPQSYPSWHLNENTCQWVAPKAMPDDGRAYTWDEGLQRWK
jgi:hypothetical protein